MMTRKAQRTIGGNGYSLLPDDDEVRFLDHNSIPRDLEIASNGITQAIEALEKVLRRLPKGETANMVKEIGQQIVNVGGFIASAQDAKTGNYRYSDGLDRFGYPVEPAEPAAIDKASRFRCAECGRLFDMLDEEQAGEWYSGHDCEVA